MQTVIGIDVSKYKLDCAYFGDSQKQKSNKMQCKNDLGTFESILIWAEALTKKPRKSLIFIIEPTSIYHELLVRFLFEAGATVYLVNPARVRKFAEGIGILSKNDVIDADVLTRYGLMATNLTAYSPSLPEIEALRSLMNRLDALEDALRRETNRQEKVGKTTVIHPLEKKSIARFIKQLEKEIAQFKKSIRQVVNESPLLKQSYELLISIPGIGEKTAWLMMIVLGLQDFENASSVASFLGLNPIEKRSGKSEYRRPRLSKRGNSRYRQALYFPAMVATRKNPDIQAQYDRLTQAGKSKMCALGAAMRKLVHICYGVIKHQEPYQAQVSMDRT